MSKYVRTEDGIITVDDFVRCLLRKNARSYGKEMLNFEKTERMVDKYSTRNFYEFDICTPSDSGHLGIGRDSRHGIMPECDALKEVEETPNRKADTIEELCDWYVTFYSKDGHTEHCTYYDLDRDLFQSLIRAKSFTIYGAIWTDKGLIYVAKMNEKGEFELL